MVVVCWLVFFFFKQKTAYEMRISDWSSDVCSSDLRKTALTATPLGNGESKAGCGGISIFIQVMTVKWQSRLQSQAITRTKTDRLYLFEGAQIGRASCRERVCQYG